MRDGEAAFGMETVATSDRVAGDQRRRNAASVANLLLRRGPLPRVDVAEALGLSTGAVSRITRELADFRLLRELDPIETSDVGRRRVPLDLDSPRFLTVGANIGYDSIICGLVDLRGSVVGDVEVVDQAAMDPDGVVRQLAEVVARVVERRPEGALILGTGVSVAGQVDTSGFVTDLDLLGWQNVDLPGLLEGRVPGVIVVDAVYRAVARAEGWFGAAQRVDSFVQLFARHAIGAAVVTGGVDHPGAGGRAGTIAHLPVSGVAHQPCPCGRQACLTSVASIDAIVQRVRDEGFDVKDFPDVLRLAPDEERIAAILLARDQALGEGIASLMDLLAPDRVILSVSGMTGPDVDVIRAAADRWSSVHRDVSDVIMSSALGGAETANVVGTATAVLARFYEDPIAHMLSLS